MHTTAVDLTATIPPLPREPFFFFFLISLTAFSSDSTLSLSFAFTTTVRFAGNLQEAATRNLLPYVAEKLQNLFFAELLPSYSVPEVTSTFNLYTWWRFFSLMLKHVLLLRDPFHFDRKKYLFSVK
jgi:hypothetical protein